MHKGNAPSRVVIAIIALLLPYYIVYKLVSLRVDVYSALKWAIVPYIPIFYYTFKEVITNPEINTGAVVRNLLNGKKWVQPDRFGFIYPWEKVERVVSLAFDITMGNKHGDTAPAGNNAKMLPKWQSTLQADVDNLEQFILWKWEDIEQHFYSVINVKLGQLIRARRDDDEVITHTDQIRTELAAFADELRAKDARKYGVRLGAIELRDIDRAPDIQEISEVKMEMNKILEAAKALADHPMGTTDPQKAFDEAMVIAGKRSGQSTTLNLNGLEKLGNLNHLSIGTLPFGGGGGGGKKGGGGKGGKNPGAKGGP